MNREQESLTENLNLIYRLKEQAESLRQESDMLLSGMRAILAAPDRHHLYKETFELFRTIIPYEFCFVLDPHEPGYMKCSATTDERFLSTTWQVDTLLKKALSERPIAIFNAKIQPTWKQQNFDGITTPASVLYCPFRVSKHKSIIVFCTNEIGFYTQHHVAIAQRYREFTEQTFLSVQAKLKALESEQLREDKERAERSMLHSEKMASLGLLAAGVAHEINNPVAFIKSNVDFLNSSLPMIKQLLTTVKSIAESNVLDASHKAQLDTLINEQELLYFADDMQDICNSTSDGVKRVTDIISSLKTFTRTDEKNEDQAIDVNECIENSLRLVSSEFKNNIRVEKTLAGALPMLAGNPGKFNQVIVNLFINAAQSMDTGGTVSVVTRKTGAASIDNKNGLFIDIKDSGCGINERDLSQIFQPFYTTKPVGEGTGLGLYITFSLVESLGGKITVTSQVNEGTEFSIFFPAECFLSATEPKEA